MCTEKHVLVLKNLYKWDKRKFRHYGPDSSWRENSLSGKDKIPTAVVSKSHVGSLLEHANSPPHC